uniref:Uncharacterized protein LOC105649495 n=1 Tax=Rhizophora mucronata TaxID=61149 RepID=A0A2P2KS54_RHIMU
MMVMAEASSGPFLVGSGEDDLTMDMETFFHILDESTDPLKRSAEDSSNDNLKVDTAPDAGNHTDFQFQSGHQMVGGVAFDTGGDFTMVFDDVKLEPSLEISSSIPVSSENFWHIQGDQGINRAEVQQYKTHSCTGTSTLVEGVSNHVSDNNEDHLGLNFLSEASCSLWMQSQGGKSGYSGPMPGNCFGVSVPQDDIKKFVDKPFMDIDFPSNDIISNVSTLSHNSDIISNLDSNYSALPSDISIDSLCFTKSPQYNFYDGFGFEPLPNEVEELQSLSACSGSTDYGGVHGLEANCLGGKSMSPNHGNLSSNADVRLIDHKASVVPFHYNQSGCNKNQTVCVENKKIDDMVASRGMAGHSVGATDEPVNIKHPCNYDSCLSFSCDKDEGSKHLSSEISPFLNWKQVDQTENEKHDLIVASTQSCLVGGFPTDDAHAALNASEQYLSCAQPYTINSKQYSCIRYEREGREMQPSLRGSHLSSVSPESIQSNSSGSKSHVDDDADICILDDTSQPAYSNQSLQLGKVIDPLQNSAYSQSLHYTGGLRTRANDEGLKFRAALQDLSQQKSEANPPDGMLAVPLLRHQRIALSWMVRKETSGGYCLGGILADDQGLGKTVSTIALILKERPLYLKQDLKTPKKEEFEALDLDEDDDEVIEVDGVKKVADGHQFNSSRSYTKSSNSCGQSKGRTAAGTLIVCPTSVLRQWAEELHKKVTSKADLSVLVYHGSNRTNNPCELGKYDVVLTTYSIVSMEVPKKPLVDEDDVNKAKLEGSDVSPLRLSSGKRRKHPPISGKKCSNGKKELADALLDSLARPLAKVAWFRVVLDEAQSIKNHRTQVARACWGLRAKRRWCLSGTPLQNAVDDLYSYFRFLRYDPYDVYNNFCSAIKMPIQKNPTEGYKRLQAVLKTIMLRRTKGTLLDGEPIINLPPKMIELKKVDFTEEERDFYTRLETDSRAQFKEYAAAGTVKQNYVNILLMLLRLRQACDHPLLVRGLDSNLLGRSSKEMAKKLPHEKRMQLLQHLEASFAICGICGDPPEDAVVAVCGHVFCNQCICEHLTSDDKQCPTSNCKQRLNISSVFSKATLNCPLSDQTAQDDSASKTVEVVKNFPGWCPQDSSKVRAALEVLRSLSKTQDSISGNSTLENLLDGNVMFPETSASWNSLNFNKKEVNLLAEHNVRDSTKLAGEKAIVFSQWTRMLDLLEACLKSSSIPYRRLDGTMSVVARDKAVKDFNTLPEVSVMIMSLKAASLGLNMVAACHVLLLDLWWNPTTEDQAIDRAHRIGQTRPVTVLRLTVKDTVEDRILALQVACSCDFFWLPFC